MNTNTTTTTNEKQAIIDALWAWIRQRPGLEFGNYGDWKAYRQELREIARDKHDAETVLRAVAWRDSIDAETLKAAFSANYGRLEWNGTRLSYTTGQYWPTEYRKAAAAVLARALWYNVRNNFDGEMNPGAALRAYFRREFGRGIASRWFN
ncbi:MAG TPA: hypothetical protein PLI09_28075 [Candidatus Hydrogenedentes bacterium]|nr:hypothetical protein [Candidatus Hydrogenedentota bacterium]